jgi:hypothetical protein
MTETYRLYEETFSQSGISQGNGFSDGQIQTKENTSEPKPGSPAEAMVLGQGRFGRIGPPLSDQYPCRNREIMTKWPLFRL